VSTFRHFLQPIKNRNNNMLQSSTRHSSAALGRVAALTLVAAAVLSACGGGGGDPGAVPPASGTGTGTGTTTPTPTVTAETKVSLALMDGSNKAVTSLSGGQSGTLKATVLTPAGQPAVGAIVQFATATDGMIVFTPATGSALTDANGVAVVTVKPASYTTAGALAVTATSVVEGKTGSSDLNIAIGAAPLTVGALSFSPAPTGALPAFNTVALNIPVTSGGQKASVSTGLTLTSLCVGDGTATLVPGAMSDGVQTATYTNNGCVRLKDTITAAIGNSSQTIGIDVTAANIGTVQFSSSSTAGTSIVLKGSGGQGRSESAQVNFRVVDQQGNGLAGVDVDFSATTYTGNLAVSPLRATTDASGNVSATVSSGTIPTPVRVIATARRNGISITGLSDALTISTGLPIQRSMSVSAEKVNFEGWGYDGETIKLSARMADQYGNPVSDGTAVNFVTEGGAVGSASQGACMTTNGECSVDLRSQNFRPTNGRVTVLAFAQGVENFVDMNGDGQYSCTDFVDADGKVPATYRPLVDTCRSGGEPWTDMGDAFLDTNNNGAYNPADNDLPFPYNHTSYTVAGNNQWGLNYIRMPIEVVFSGSFANMTRMVCSGSTCRDWTAADGVAGELVDAAGPGCKAQDLYVRVADVNNNPMPAGTTVTVSAATKVTASAVAPELIGSTNDIGGTIHSLTVTPDASCAVGDITLQVKTPKGNITSFKFNAI
jgi:hypothetical protein